MDANKDNSYKPPHLIVENGPEAGRELVIPDDGARIGRAPENDIVLSDPSVSRFQCRLFFKEHFLYAADLGSTNETLVNDQPVREAPLRVGDNVLIGECIMRVVNDGMGDHPEPVAGAVQVKTDDAVEAPAPTPGSSEVVDLGLRRERRMPSRPSREATDGAGRQSNPLKLLLVAFATLIVVGALILVLFGQGTGGGDPSQTLVKAPNTLEIDYEKIKATADNIFRYKLNLAADGTLRASVKNLANGRNITKSVKVDPELLQKLRADILLAEFFTLEKSYEGLAQGVYDLKDMRITMGYKTHRSVVKNRLEPSDFKRVRELVEKFSEGSLSLAALALPPEQLLEMAEEKFRLGRQLYDAREVEYKNLFAAIQAFREVEWYLESIEPKPPIYAEAIAGIQQYEDELEKRYETELFLAAQAKVQLNWVKSANHLRRICQMIPDRSDERYKETYKILLDAERRIDR